MQDIATFLPEWDIVEVANHDDETWFLEQNQNYPRLFFEKEV